MSLENGTYSADEWSRKIVCPECNHVFQEGEIFSQKLLGVAEDGIMTKIVCVPCGLGIGDEH